MRTNYTAAITVGALLLAGCGGDGAYEWGVPYAPGASDDDDDDEPSDEDDAAADDEDEDAGGSDDEPDDDEGEGEASTSGATADPTVDPSAGEESTGEPQDSADTGESPYQGGWDIGSCQDMQAADVADFSLTDQYGDSVRLYDFCHKAILLTAGSFW